jgi:PKHD-type hydroxylase
MNDEVGKRVDINLGDLLMYRGEELVHWRPAFKGKWQCQVFFHFVDANGPHAAQKFDGRPQLGLSSATRVQEDVNPSEASATVQDKPFHGDTLPAEQSAPAVFPIFNGVMIPSWNIDLPGLLTVNNQSHPHFAFTPEECDAVISFANEDYADPGSIGVGSKGSVNKEIRNVNLYRIPLTDNTKWIFDKVSRVVSFANADYFKYEIMGITHELQLLHYESGSEPGHYNWHMDVGPMTSATRKISVSIQLTDPNAYEGGELTVNSNGQELMADDSQGTLNLFPSYCMHRVAPMKEGERWALVIWVHGSQRFK